MSAVQPVKVKQGKVAQLVINPADKTGTLNLRLSQAQLDSAFSNLEDQHLTPHKLVDVITADQTNVFSRQRLDKTLKDDKSHSVDSLNDLKELHILIHDELGQTYTLRDLERIVRERGLTPAQVNAKPILLKDDTYKLAIDKAGRGKMNVYLTEEQFRQALGKAAEPGDMTPVDLLQLLSWGKSNPFNLDEVNRRVRLSQALSEANSVSDLREGVEVSVVADDKPVLSLKGKPDEKTRPVQVAQALTEIKKENGKKITPTPPKPEELENILHKRADITKGLSRLTPQEFQDKCWKILSEGERRWWANRTKTDMPMLRPRTLNLSNLEETAKENAHTHYARWSYAKKEKDGVLWQSLADQEREYWMNTVRPSTPQFEENTSKEEARDKLLKYYNATAGLEGKAEKKAIEHYRKGGMIPVTPKPEELYDFTFNQVRERVGRVTALRNQVNTATEGLNVESLNPFDALSSAVEGVQGDTLKAVSLDTYEGYATTETDKKVVGKAFRKAIEPLVRSMEGGEKRVEILRRFGIVVADGNAVMPGREIDKLHSILENTPPHILDNGMVGSIIWDRVPTSEARRARGLFTMGRYKPEHKRIHNTFGFLDPATIHHEIGHGVHFSLGEEQFVDFARLGGWEVWEGEEKGVSRQVREGDNFRYADIWKSPPSTHVVREYGRTHPYEDFATLYGDYTSDTRKLLEKALFHAHESKDYTLLKKTFWMMKNVYGKPETGEVYAYTRDPDTEEGNMHIIRVTDHSDTEGILKQLDGIHQREAEEYRNKRREEAERRSVTRPFDGKKVLERILKEVREEEEMKKKGGGGQK